MSFIFIPNLVSFEGKLPCRLTEKYTLQRASRSQAEWIRSILTDIVPIVGDPPSYDKTFIESVVLRSGKRRPHRWKRRSQSDWLFWVITFEGRSFDHESLARALALLKKELYLSYTVGLNAQGEVVEEQFRAEAIIQYFTEARIGDIDPIVIKVEELAKVESYIKLIEDAAAKETPAHFALREFMDLQSLPYTSNFQVLGCFAVIESLLTHKQNDKEVGDSLTHQLETKLTLLEKMFERPLNFAPFGNSIGKDKVWKALYSYRSLLAHGSRFEFEKKFSTLRSREVALDFLREVTKLAILIALEKPEFIEDLKAV